MDRLPMSSRDFGARRTWVLSAAIAYLPAAGCRPLSVLEQVLAAAPDAVHPFRQVDALEPGGEGAHHVARQRRRAVAHAGRELGARLGLAAAAADGGEAVQLHQLEQLLATLLAQNLAHERAERTHILAQRLVLGRKVDVVAVHLQSFQVLALASKSVRCARTTQKFWPVGAAITYQVPTGPMRRAPSFSSRPTSASMSSASMSRCTRLG